MNLAFASARIAVFKVRGHRRILETRDSICGFHYDIAIVDRLPSIAPLSRNVEWLPNRNVNNWAENYRRLRLDV